ncbi:hypothetical protein ACN261_08180 [Micromonospora sp. WMMD723]|uniref:hypothetical protein n=1 Tax=Micromonospora sp. WMMD723 TaxID=3403465 RepID=UPI003CF74BCB
MDWRSRLSMLFLAPAGGMSVNLVSNDFGYPAVAAATVAGAVLWAAASLRRLPPRAPLVRYTARALLALALLAAIVAAFGPAPWSAYATLTAVVLAATAVLTVNAVDAALALLLNVALVGTGVAVVGSGIANLTTSILGVTVILMGVTFTLVGAVALLAGISLVGTGSPIFTDRELEIIGNDIALQAELTKTIKFTTLCGKALTLGGMVIIGTGIAEAAPDNRFLDSAMTTVVGMMITGTGISLQTNSRLLDSVMIIAFGVATAGGGIANLTSSHILVGAGRIGVGVAVAGGGIAVLIRHTDLTTRLREWRATLTQDPTSKESAAQNPGQEQGASDAQPPS